MNARHLLTWILAAAMSVAAAVLIARHDTPIDDALPFIVLIVTVVAAVTHAGVQCAVPLLLAGEIVSFDERVRLLWLGVVLAGAFAAAILTSRSKGGSVVVAIAAILLLRWIPLDQVMIGRELLIVAVGAGIVLALRCTPLAIAVAVMTALFTPAVPLRTLLIPIGVLIVCAVARFFGVAHLRLPVTASFAVAVVLTFFSWSGAFARALPLMLRGGPPQLARMPVSVALEAGQSAEVDVPSNGAGLVLSGANVPRLRAGTVIGRIEPGGIVVRIGDVADWGVLRREHYYRARNPLPARPGGLLRGYGQTSWIDASGRIPVAPGRVTVTAGRELPPGAKLQIDAIELAR